MRIQAISEGRGISGYRIWRVVHNNREPGRNLARNPKFNPQQEIALKLAAAGMRAPTGMMQHSGFCNSTVGHSLPSECCEWHGSRWPPGASRAAARISTGGPGLQRALLCMQCSLTARLDSAICTPATPATRCRVASPSSTPRPMVHSALANNSRLRVVAGFATPSISRIPGIPGFNLAICDRLVYRATPRHDLDPGPATAQRCTSHHGTPVRGRSRA